MIPSEDKPGGNLRTPKLFLSGASNGAKSHLDPGLLRQDAAATGRPPLSHDAVNDVPFDIGQAHVAAAESVR